MATTEALKGKNALITAASIVGAVALEFLLERRGDAGKAGKKVSDAVGNLPGNAGNLMDDLGRGVKSVTGKATAAVRGDGDEDQDGGQRSNDGAEFDLDELAGRRNQREQRREQRRKAI
jgi:hypothetical protein